LDPFHFRSWLQSQTRTIGSHRWRRS
jgi:hypothetical protein